MRALVTGGAGFIGSNLVDALLARGDEVTVLDNISTGRRENLDGALAGGAELAEVDLRDAGAVDGLVERSRPDAIFHLGAQVDVRKSVGDPAFDAAVNVGGTVNVLSAANAHGVGRVVFASTGGAIYGEVPDHPGNRGFPRCARGPVRALQVLRRELLRPVQPPAWPLHRGAALRQRLRARARTRSARPGSSRSTAAWRSSGGRPVVFGDGLQTRDYVHVDDIVPANLLAAESDAGGVVQRRPRRGGHGARPRRGAGPARGERLRAGVPAGAQGRGAARIALDAAARSRDLRLGVARSRRRGARAARWPRFAKPARFHRCLRPPCRALARSTAARP